MCFVAVDVLTDRSSLSQKFLATPSPVNCCCGIVFISVEEPKW